MKSAFPEPYCKKVGYIKKSEETVVCNQEIHYQIILEYGDTDFAKP